MASHNYLEEKFARLFQEEAPDIPLQRQVTHDLIRGKKQMLPFDFGIVGLPILIEIDGGGSFGAHARPKGMKRDAYKSNKAQMLGYKIFRFTTAMVTRANVKELVYYIRNAYELYKTPPNKSTSGRR